LNLRRATAADAPALGALHIQAMRALTFLPQLHTVDEAVAWMGGDVLPTHEVLVAETDGEVEGYIACTDGWINQLYVRPDRQGRGVGAALLEHVLADGAPRRLWTFQQNDRARRFYEARGFTLLRLTDGAGNEEKTPDALYERRGRDRAEIEDSL
jgi:GNAT superfamily N-acetyltransferase